MKIMMASNDCASTWRRLLPGQRSQVWTYDVTTGDRHLVLDVDDAVVEAPNWHPRLDELLVNADGWLWRVPLDGSDPQRVDTGTSPEANNDHVLSPDGEMIYISNRAGELTAAPYMGGSPVLVSKVRATPFRHYLHGVSPDGETLAYIGHDARATVNTFEVYSLHLPTGVDIQITDTEKHHDGCEFSADGTRIYLNSERASTISGHSQIFSMALDGSDVIQLTHDDRVNWFPHEAPDGSCLVYLSFPPGTLGHPPNVDVELRTLADGTPVTLHRFLGGQGSFNVNSWAPDSRRFAYVEYPVR